MSRVAKERATIGRGTRRVDAPPISSIVPDFVFLRKAFHSRADNNQNAFSATVDFSATDQALFFFPPLELMGQVVPLAEMFLTWVRVSISLQNFSPQMSHGYGDKSPVSPIPGEMASRFHTRASALFRLLYSLTWSRHVTPRHATSRRLNLFLLAFDRAHRDLVEPPDLPALA